ncbi:chemotaxis protein CheD [Gracilibacillus halotolerans]|uniref:Probable chemoreceptor glutamine deamidase CheD n=1 Tax=Gracilibacillus halotolerans TaxID=74386 RepID=A0A841RHE9_9BACI|nr:chemotaxis protein CheD [Gracilibacillus halotolerans]MBB6511462.1 chemotaxis protein CheD [Gracilibacillus halotolerans]
MTITSTVVKVGIADMKVTEAPNKLKTLGLGSCVGVVIYNHEIAGLAHVMLPDSEASNRENQNILKYADSALDQMIRELLDKGVRKSSLKAKIAGGAHMFSFQTESNFLKIGERNIIAVTERLQLHQIPLIAQDVGGNQGRTIEFNIEESQLEIRTVRGNTTII